MTSHEIYTRASAAFARRDALEREMRVIDAELQALRSAHMTNERVWGLHMAGFRRAVEGTKAA